MKVKLRDPVADVMRAISVSPPMMGTNAIKREVSIVEFVGETLQQSPHWHGEEARFHCFRPENHSNGDAKPSLWARDVHDGGYPRCGCNVCGWSDDVFGFLVQKYGVTPQQAIKWVADWLARRSGNPGRRITVRPPSRGKEARKR